MSHISSTLEGSLRCQEVGQDCPTPMEVTKDPSALEVAVTENPAPEGGAGGYPAHEGVANSDPALVGSTSCNPAPEGVAGNDPARVVLGTCSQMLGVKNKATQKMLNIKILRPSKHYFP